MNKRSSRSFLGMTVECSALAFLALAHVHCNGSAKGPSRLEGSAGAAGGAEASTNTQDGSTEERGDQATPGAEPQGDDGSIPPEPGLSDDDTGDAATSVPDASTGDAGSGNTAKTVCLNADGPGGVETYALIHSVLGPNSIEVPDTFHTPAFKHVKEADDPDVVHCFVFYMHRDIDGDPVSGKREDRQRCEMKVFAPSPNDLKGTTGTTFVYMWRFKLNADMPVSTKFTHVFQLKSVGGDDGHPVITLTGAKKGGVDKFQVRYSPSQTDEILAEADWSDARGKWLAAYVKATFAPTGSIEVKIAKPDGTTLIAVPKATRSMWRGGEFIRPKWGIYRSIDDLQNLSNAEDSVRFANIGITAGSAPSTDCRL